MAGPLVTDLVQIRRLGERKRGENMRLRVHLKTHNYVERKLRKIGQDIQDTIDCHTCANCCRVAEIEPSSRDIEHLAKFLRITREQFLERYTMLNKEGAVILKRSATGCVFLNGYDCSVYEARPAGCEHFPHIVKGEGPISTRMWSLVDRATYCPIVYNALEAFKDETNFKRG